MFLNSCWGRNIGDFSRDGVKWLVAIGLNVDITTGVYTKYP